LAKPVAQPSKVYAPHSHKQNNYCAVPCQQASKMRTPSLRVHDVVAQSARILGKARRFCLGLTGTGRRRLLQPMSCSSRSWPAHCRFDLLRCNTHNHHLFWLPAHRPPSPPPASLSFLRPSAPTTIMRTAPMQTLATMMPPDMDKLNEASTWRLLALQLTCGRLC